MFDQFKQTLTKLVAAGNERTNVVRMRGTLERLEDRMMLSATYGDFGYNRSAPVSHPYGDFGPPVPANSAVFAPQQQYSGSSYNSPSFSGVRDVRPEYDGLYGQLSVQSAFLSSHQPDQGGQRQAQLASWNQSFAVPPPHQEMIVYEWGPGYSSISYLETTPRGTLAISRFDLEPPPVPNGAPPLDFDDPGAPAPPSYRLTSSNNRPTPLITPNNGNNPYGLRGGETIVVWMGNGGLDLARNLDGNRNDLYRNLHDTNPGSNLGASNVNGIGNSSGSESLRGRYYSTGSDMPIASQVLSRETSTLAALTAGARDVAFQEFTASLCQPNATTSFDRTDLEALGRDTTQSSVIDGLISSPDEVTNNVVTDSSDAVTREREAVDAVLNELEDVDSLVPTPESQTQSRNVELPTDTAFDDFPAGEVDGGMVLLQSTGDANGNGLDLTPVYAEHVERLTAPAKIEASIGIFYQAMDVATDDVPLLESGPQNSPISQLQRDIKSQEQLPAKRDASSPSKAATIIGATTLTGALVWMNRGGRVARQKSTAQKRRVVRG